jgi:hypothetical protein
MAGVRQMAAHHMDALRYYLSMEYSAKIRRTFGSEADALTALMCSSTAYAGRYSQISVSGDNYHPRLLDPRKLSDARDERCNANARELGCVRSAITASPQTSR